MKISISNTSIKRCRNKFPIKGIGKVVNSALLLFSLDIETIIAEFICDSDNDELYNILLYLIRENCKDSNILNELKKFDYIILKQRLKKQQ